MTATSSSAIVTKLLIELQRLANHETPMILGVTVVEDIFIAIYLAIVSVVLSGETDFWPIAGASSAIAFTFLVVMFTHRPLGRPVVSRLFRTKDDELFTILFFGLAVLFGGIGEVLGVTDAIGAFLIGLVLGATRYRTRIEHIALPLRDVFARVLLPELRPRAEPGAVPARCSVPVLLAVVHDDRAEHRSPASSWRWLNGFGAAGRASTPRSILQNRGEFALILATLSLARGTRCAHASRSPASTC